MKVKFDKKGILDFLNEVKDRQENEVEYKIKLNRKTKASELYINTNRVDMGEFVISASHDGLEIKFDNTRIDPIHSIENKLNKKTKGEN